MYFKLTGIEDFSKHMNFTICRCRVELDNWGTLLKLCESDENVDIIVRHLNPILTIQVSLSYLPTLIKSAQALLPDASLTLDTNMLPIMWVSATKEVYLGVLNTDTEVSDTLPKSCTRKVLEMLEALGLRPKDTFKFRLLTCVEHSKYRYFILGMTNHDLREHLDEIRVVLDKNNIGKYTIVFDNLLFTGNTKDRFFDMEFNSAGFSLDTLTMLNEKPNSVLRKIGRDFFMNEPSVALTKSALSTKDKMLLCSGQVI